jgi:hypothetical protein
MTSTELPTPTAPAPPRYDEAPAEILPILGTVVVAGPPVLLGWLGTVLLALMLAGPFALLVTLAAVVVAAIAVVALAGAILASPYLVVRHLRGRWAHRTTGDAATRVVIVGSQRVAA